MSKPLKIGKKRAVKASKPVLEAGKFPRNPIPKTPPSPYAQALMFALAVIATAGILFTAIKSAKVVNDEPNFLPGETQTMTPRINPPTAPPPLEQRSEPTLAEPSPLEPVELR